MTSVLKAAAPVRGRLFGAFALEGPGGPVRIRSRRARALIAYLALTPSGASRERLSGLLWSDRGEEQARASLRQCLLELRKEFADAGVDLLDVGREQVRLHPAVLVNDVADLEQAMAAPDIPAFAAALRAIGGERLIDDLRIGGVYDEWLGRTRAQLESTLEREAHRAVREAEGRGAWEELRGFAEAYLLRYPADEMVAAAAIRADMALGATSTAHRRFRALESTLAQEYGVKPGTSVSQALATEPRPAPAARMPEPTRPAVAGPVTPIVVVTAFGGEAAEQMGDLLETVFEEVVAGLARFRDLAVVTHATHPSDVDQRAFAAPGLVFVLSARARSRPRPMLTVQLSRLITRAVLWSDSFELPESEILRAIETIVARVLGAVTPSIDLDLAPTRRDSGAPSDYVRHLQAKGQAHAAETHEQALAAAVELEALIAENPRFAPPYLSLAYLYNTDFNHTLAGSSDADRRERALELAKMAISLDRGHSHGYVVAAWCYLRQHRWEPARQLFEQAYNLNPFHPTRMVEIGLGLLFLDERERARELFDRCLLVNPTPQDNYFMDLGLLELVCAAHDRAGTYFELVAAPAFWSAVHMAINAELGEGANAAALSRRALARIERIWPAERPRTAEAVLDWIVEHHPFRAAETGAPFLEGARRMLARA